MKNNDSSNKTTTDTSTQNLVHFNKYGVSDDKKYLLGVGLSSNGSRDTNALNKIGATWGKRVYKNYCPYCKTSGNLIWGIFWGNGVVPGKGTHEGSSAEGGIFCKKCDKDYSIILGYDRITGDSTLRLTPVTDLTKSSKQEALNLKKNGATIDLNTMNFSDSSSSSSTSCKDYTKGFDISKPFQAYFQVDYGKCKHNQNYNPKGKTSTIYIDFTADSDVKTNGFSGLSPVMVNNATREISVNLLPYIKSLENDTTGVYDYYVKQIKLVYDTPSSEKLYESDGSDNSSNKILLASLGFSNLRKGNPVSFESCGKTLLECVKTVLETSEYDYKVEYNNLREDDYLNFYYNNSEKPVFTIREDDDRFIGLNNIEYTPVESLNNSVYKVYKVVNKDNVAYYNYTNTRLPKSVFMYGEKESLESLSDGVSSSEAYYKARYDTDTYDEQLDFSYTVEWEGVPPLSIGDYVECIMDNDHYTDIKQVKSLSYKCTGEDAVNIVTTIGLDEVEPRLKLKSNIKSMRNSIKSKSTVYSKGTTYDTSNTPYTWNGTSSNVKN